MSNRNSSAPAHNASATVLPTFASSKSPDAENATPASLIGLELSASVGSGVTSASVSPMPLDATANAARADHARETKRPSGKRSRNRLPVNDGMKLKIQRARTMPSERRMEFPPTDATKI